MTTLNQRILIPTGPSAVWAIISDINKNPNWQTDCQSVSFLTSLRAGARVRWRCTTPQSDEYVIETTAWYDGLGYEYTYIDGSPFRESKGTIRLQEIAEGTIVSWTLNYEMGGALGALRNSLTVRRHFDAVMIASLKALWTHVKETGAAQGGHEARSLMRDAPDYEARAQYVSRHPSNTAEEDMAAAESLLTEPPVADDDTKPNEALTDAPASETESAEAEPVAAAASESDERFRPPTPTRAEVELSTVEEAKPEVVTAPEEQPEPEQEAAAPEEASEPVMEPAARATGDTPLPIVRPSDTEQLPITARDRFGPKIDTTEIDTKDISIWEVFNVPKPSESQRLRAVAEQEAAAAAAVTPPSTAPVPEPDADDHADTPTPGETAAPVVAAPAQILTTSIVGLALRMGFRYLARQKLITLRRHK